MALNTIFNQTWLTKIVENGYEKNLRILINKMSICSEFKVSENEYDHIFRVQLREKKKALTKLSKQMIQY